MTIPPEKPRRRVQLESPFAGRTPADLTANAIYLTACLRDSLLRGEAPFASHRLYTEALDDKDPEERQMGIEAGLAYVEVAEATVVYTDRGISGGMHIGIERAEKAGRPVEMRSLKGALKGDVR